MKALFLSVVGAFLTFATLNAQNAVVTETVTTSSGTLHQYAPGTSFVLQETSGPVTYSYGPSVVYATSAGAILTPEQIQARIRVGVPVHVDYMTQGDTRIIRRVVVDEDEDDDDDGN